MQYNYIDFTLLKKFLFTRDQGETVFRRLWLGSKRPFLSPYAGECARASKFLFPWLTEPPCHFGHLEIIWFREGMRSKSDSGQELDLEGRNGVLISDTELNQGTRIRSK